MRTYHVNGTLPEDDSIFVFGSNILGNHLGGAAKVAFEEFYAEMGCSAGIVGLSYAIPTLDTNFQPIALNVINEFVKAFIWYSKEAYSEDETYFVTAIGTQICGYSHSDIAPMFEECGDNCSFPEEWKEFLE